MIKAKDILKPAEELQALFHKGIQDKRIPRKAQEIQTFDGYVEGLKHKILVSVHCCNVLNSFDWNPGGILDSRLPASRKSDLSAMPAEPTQQEEDAEEEVEYFFKTEAASGVFVLDFVRRCISDCVNATDTLAHAMNACFQLGLPFGKVNIKSVYDSISNPRFDFLQPLRKKLERHAWQQKRGANREPIILRPSWLSDLRTIRGVFQHGSIHDAFSQTDSVRWNFSPEQETLFEPRHFQSNDFKNFEVPQLCNRAIVLLGELITDVKESVHLIR